MSVFIATLKCPDRSGVIHEMAGAILATGGNILEQAQFTDESSNLFSMRTRFETSNHDIDAVQQAINDAAPITTQPDTTFTLRKQESHRRVLIMVSQHDHCLADLLYRHSNGELPIDIPAVVSNHESCRELVERHGIPFHHIPVTSETKLAAESALTKIINDQRIDAIVLARYMQILSEGFCVQHPGRIINIHHSFLPGFKGARPYHQAHERGVKLIGATAHFVTADLDEGPIIEQEVERVNHAQTADELASIGKDIERVVLSRAVKLYAEDRIQLLGQRTVVFA